MACPSARTRCSSAVNTVAAATVLVAIIPGAVACSGGEKSAQSPQASPSATASTTESGASPVTGSSPPPSAALGHTPPSIVIDGRSIDVPTGPEDVARCTPIHDDAGAYTEATWTGGRANGPNRPGDVDTRVHPDMTGSAGHPGITVILAFDRRGTALGNGISIQPAAGLTTYATTDSTDPKHGTVAVTGPDNAWYTFSGTVAEEVRSEADGHITGADECTSYGNL
jgi:hypothetical protein